MAAEADKEASGDRGEADGKRAINEARNALNGAQIELEIRLERLRRLPEIIAQSVKLMEHIDAIKIIDVRGMNQPDGDARGSASDGKGNPARSVVDHTLRYRVQRPLVDALLREVGLEDVADLSGLVGERKSGEAEASPPPSPPSPQRNSAS